MNIVEPSTAILSSTYSQFQLSPIFKKVTRTKLRQFCNGLSLVALCVRIGLLFDAFALRDPRIFIVDAFIQMLSSLRQTIAEFRDVVLVHEPNSQGIFFVNIKLLRSRLPSGPNSYSHPLSDGAGNAWTYFILLSQHPTLLESMPPHLTSLLMQLCSLKDSSSPLPPSVTLSLSQPLQITDTVPFAGFILEYPVAYVPTLADQTSFLADVPLDVYECVLLDPDCTREEEHTMLKFSCPCTVGAAQDTLSPSRLPEILQSHFEPRLKHAGFLGSLVVRHHTETLARVAL